MNFERLWPEWIFPLITNQGKGTKEPSEQAFIKIKKYDTLESNSLSLAESPLWAQVAHDVVSSSPCGKYTLA